MLCITINVDESSPCSIYLNTALAVLIAKAKLIIWDEAPMMQKYGVETKWVLYNTS